MFQSIAKQLFHALIPSAHPHLLHLPLIIASSSPAQAKHSQYPGGGADKAVTLRSQLLSIRNADIIAGAIAIENKYIAVMDIKFNDQFLPATHFKIT